MNREDVIRLAGEAGFGANQRNTLLVKIERFADLVVKEMINDGWRQCAKGQRTTQFCGMAEKAREEEREECAKVCDDQAEYADEHLTASAAITADRCAAAIRRMAKK